MIHLYHGSAERVKSPQCELCKAHNDYGPGFYCTLDQELAQEWACFRGGRSGYCNHYLIDESGLAILDLDAAPYTPLNWIALLLKNRRFDAGVNAEVLNLFVSRYGVDVSGADVIGGYRADDSYFAIARAFLDGGLTDKQVESALRLGKLGRQFVVVSQLGFEGLHFVDALPVDADIWYPRWSERDATARKAFRDMRSGSSWTEGKRIYELIG